MTPAEVARKTAEVRREEILEAAVKAFAAGGLHGTSTEDIAAGAGLSQPYLFRLFGTKKDLFIASCRRCMRRILGTFQAAAEGKHGEEALRAIGESYARLLDDREMLLGQMQMYAACGDHDVRDAAREGFAELYRYVERVSGAPAEVVRDFFAKGMLMNVAAAMDLPELCSDDAWAHKLPRKE